MHFHPIEIIIFAAKRLTPSADSGILQTEGSSKGIVTENSNRVSTINNKAIHQGIALPRQKGKQ
ncbi:MAG TPA: hypothetical protein VIF60_06780, partial [Burkholderiaceae bacterium]